MKVCCLVISGILLLNSVSLSGDFKGNRGIVLQAINIAERHSIYSARQNWPEIKKEILPMVNRADSEDDLFRILQRLIDRLNDNHSFLLTPGGKRWGKKSVSGDMGLKNLIPLEKLKDEKIAYIDVNPMSSAVKTNMKTYAGELFHRIASSFKKDMTGWILDFRKNTGGQLWPMLAGLSLLIDSEIAGTALYPNRNRWQWWARRGKAGVGGNIHFQIKGTDGISLSPKPIVILIGKQTASSGEACVISFIGKENVCVIGEQTRGLATVNQPFKLNNGSVLMLTTAFFGDRNKKSYPDGIQPDLMIAGDSGRETDGDPLIDAGIEWLNKHR